MTRLRVFLWGLVALCVGVFGLFAYQLSQPKDDFIQSAMIGKPMPQLDLRPAVDGLPGLTTADLANGRPKLVNVFASWCIPCRVEAPQLEALRQNGVDIVAIAIRDRPEDLAQFFAVYGNPFTRVGADDVSEVQLSIGSSGVPETFVVDGRGIIRYQHIGEIRPEHVALLMAKLQEAGA